MFSCCLTGATPAVVLVEVETVVSPAQVPFEIAILRFEIFAAGALAVKITSAPETDTSYTAVIFALFSMAAFILSATMLAVSDEATGTERVIGEPVILLDVTTTVALPSPLRNTLQYLADVSVNFHTCPVLESPETSVQSTPLLEYWILRVSSLADGTVKISIFSVLQDFSVPKSIIIGYTSFTVQEVGYTDLS